MTGITLETFTTPVPSVGVTVDGLDTGAPSEVTVERSIPGEGWVPVPGMTGRSVTGGFFEVDPASPLAVPVTYRATIVGAVQPDTLEATITVPSSSCWLQDPVNPRTAVKVWVGAGYVKGEPYFAAESFARLTRTLPGIVTSVMGTAAPAGMGGVRQSPTGVPMTVVTEALADANRLRTLLDTAYPLMLRLIPPLTQLPPVTYLHAQVEERPRFDLQVDGTREDWVLTADVVRAPRIRVLVPRWTYADVTQLWETYGQAVDAGGGTYLAWLRDPAAPLGGFAATAYGTGPYGGELP